MSELRKSNTDYAYFITFTVVGWIDVFTRRDYCDIIIKNLKYCQQHKGMELYAYVIMPSHIHLVARNKDGKLNEIIRDFKSLTAKEIIKEILNSSNESRKEWMLYMFKDYASKQRQNKEYMFWQKTNHPIELFNPKVMHQKIEYIHNNPVEAGYVSSPENYVYSNAYNSFPKIEVWAV